MGAAVAAAGAIRGLDRSPAWSTSLSTPMLTLTAYERELGCENEGGRASGFACSDHQEPDRASVPGPGPPGKAADTITQRPERPATASCGWYRSAACQRCHAIRAPGAEGSDGEGAAGEQGLHFWWTVQARLCVQSASGGTSRRPRARRAGVQESPNNWCASLAPGCQKSDTGAPVNAGCLNMSLDLYVSTQITEGLGQPTAARSEATRASTGGAARARA